MEHQVTGADLSGNFAGTQTTFFELPHLSADKVLNQAQEHLVNRGQVYDQPQGERSMAKTVAAFNALTGLELTEEQGWLFMVVLKAARTQQGMFKLDSYEDGAAYFALAAEAGFKERT
ncbi:DUF6378 domain-containing protein [Marisediminitalea sp.]|uniref:DUF6378 domain-containing protein n=1 Tax=Marisediminitalea sp. TaxID=2662268 RepID=UPI0035184547